MRDEQESDVFEMQKKDKELEEKQRKKLKQVACPSDFARQKAGVASGSNKEWRLIPEGCAQRCPPRQNSRVKRLKENVEPLSS